MTKKGTKEYVKDSLRLSGSTTALALALKKAVER